MATLKVTNIKNDGFAGDQLYLKSDGKIGIGTASPGHKLVISQTNSGGIAAIHLPVDESTILGPNANTYLKMGGNVVLGANGQIDLTTSGASKLTIKNDGNVGIGTTNPTNLLEISGGLVRCLGTASARFTVNNGAAEGFFGWNSGTLYLGGASALLNITASGSNNIQLETNSSTRMTIKSDGNIEVGGNLKTNNLPGKNLVINGAMQIAQRSSSSSTIGYHTVDRFQIGYGGHDEVLTASHHSLTSSDTGPWEEGFRKSFHVQNGNQTSGADAGDYSQIIYKPEGQDINRSGWNFTDPNSKITLSYWIKASVAQNYYGFIEAGGPTRIFGWETGALTANTWKKVTVTIPGYASLAIPDTSGTAFSIAFIPYYGTNYTAASGRDVGQWYTAYNYLPTNTSTWWTTNDSTFEITGVQLEVGSIATEFEHRSYGDELTRCQRYFVSYGKTTGFHIGMGTAYSASALNISVPLPVPMRADPTVAKIANGSSEWLHAYVGATGTISDPTPQLGESGMSVYRVYVPSAGSGWTAGDSFWCQIRPDARLTFSAEL